jgi:hypothetical protein
MSIIVQKGEREIFQITKHPIFFYFSLWWLAVLLIFLLVILRIFKFSPISLIFGFVYLLFSATKILSEYRIWTRSVILLTNMRLVIFEQYSFFASKQREFYLDKIDDLAFASKGLFGSIFHFGDVELKINESDQNIILEDIGESERIYRKIKKAIKNYPKIKKQIQKSNKIKESKSSNKITKIKKIRL